MIKKFVSHTNDDFISKEIFNFFSKIIIITVFLIKKRKIYKNAKNKIAKLAKIRKKFYYKFK